LEGLSSKNKDYEINENNSRSAGFQPAWLSGTADCQAMQAGSLRTGCYFRLFRNPLNTSKKTQIVTTLAHLQASLYLALYIFIIFGNEILPESNLVTMIDV